MSTVEQMLAQLLNDSSLVDQVSMFKDHIVKQKKAGVIVIVDGHFETIKDAYAAQLAVNELNEATNMTYSCLVFFLDDECYSGPNKTDVIAHMKIKQPMMINIDEALDELILEAEYSYKKIGMSKHMSIHTKEQFRKRLLYQTAEMVASDMNLYFALEIKK